MSERESPYHRQGSYESRRGRDSGSFPSRFRRANNANLCHNCGQPGHFARDCRLLASYIRQENVGGFHRESVSQEHSRSSVHLPNPKACFACGELGHFQSNCPRTGIPTQNIRHFVDPGRGGIRLLTCQACGGLGHSRIHCPTELRMNRGHNLDPRFRGSGIPYVEGVVPSFQRGEPWGGSRREGSQNGVPSRFEESLKSALPGGHEPREVEFRKESHNFVSDSVRSLELRDKREHRAESIEKFQGIEKQKGSAFESLRRDSVERIHSSMRDLGENIPGIMMQKRESSEGLGLEVEGRTQGSEKLKRPNVEGLGRDSGERVQGVEKLKPYDFNDSVRVLEQENAVSVEQKSSTFEGRQGLEKEKEISEKGNPFNSTELSSKIVETEDLMDCSDRDRGKGEGSGSVLSERFKEEQIGSKSREIDLGNEGGKTGKTLAPSSTNEDDKISPEQLEKEENEDEQIFGSEPLDFGELSDVSDEQINIDKGENSDMDMEDISEGEIVKDKQLDTKNVEG